MAGEGGRFAAFARASRLDAFRRASLPVWLVSCAVLAAAIVAKVRLGVPWYVLMGDPASVTGKPFYLGFVSNVGIVAWSAIATVFLFRHHQERAARGPADWRRFLLWSGLFAALLGFDDLFLLHEQVLPDYLSIAQPFVVGAYAIACLAYLLGFAGQIARTAYPVLVVALALLAASVALDQLHDRWELYLPGSGFLEDALKLLGIGTWLSYALHTCANAPSPGARTGAFGKLRFGASTAAR